VQTTNGAVIPVEVQRESIAADVIEVACNATGVASGRCELEYHGEVLSGDASLESVRDGSTLLLRTSATGIHRSQSTPSMLATHRLGAAKQSREGSTFEVVGGKRSCDAIEKLLASAKEGVKAGFLPRLQKEGMGGVIHIF